ncbi:intermembrane lipid transfer protein VPS13C isoform X2 [Pelobates fuscus]|uniref:intermembrane lipid transfer protein VPS13C isoform X2 n=1 Tax=Pelobates fuscus TaxID=191477 RepID=UPI002FE4901A
MLESVLADLLNRFLGDYVENLDRSQLKLGIWGGNVALENLRIRENALSEFDVPFKVKAGQIDKLTLKIPWKNLYGDAVVATLEGLYLLVVPGASIKYDAEKEERHLQEAKQRELVRIEDALQKAAEKDKPKEDKKDTFLEKLATQVIKNLQVKIKNIHVRYEDDITDASIPLSVGVTLGELSLQTANESWAPCILHEATKIIYKLVCLDSFSTYWNVHSAMFYHQSREQILEDMKKGIISSNRKHKDYQYIFKPVSASAKLYMNPNAEIELNTPKLDWNMEIQHVAVELTKPQYLSMIDLLESIDYMVRNAPYRKYRPDVPLLQNKTKWWLYAINGILEVQVRKKTQMWCWKSIKQHRQNLKSYKNVYKNKLTQSKPSEELIKELQVLEKDLDVFNIVLARQQAQAEVIRSGQKLLAKKSTQGGEKKSGGWFGGLWGRKEATKKEDSELSVPEKIDDLLTPEERAKLFTAIGYSESSYNLTLPKTYVAHVLGLKLLSTSITIREDTHTPETLNVQIIGLGTKVYQRPGAKALKVEAKLEHWYVTGLCQKTVVPSLVTSIGSNKSSLLEIVFETNPENSTSDQVLILQSQPVEMIYDAITINALAEFFQTNKGMDLEQLTSATLMKLEEIKEKTAAGLNHIIETRKVLDLRINLQPSYLLLPESGFYHEKTNLIIVDFGSFQLNSINQANQQAGSVSSLEELMSKAYDKFDIKIKNIQMLFGRPGEDWKKARIESSSSLHILQPLDIEVQLEKAMVERDGRMPRFKVSGELPLLHMRISDQKLKGVFSLLDSIPFPKKTSSTPTTKPKNIPAIRILTTRPEKLFEHDIAKSLTFEEDDSESTDEYFDTDDEPSLVKTKGKEVSVKTETKSSAETVPQELTDLHLKFEVKEVAIELNKQLEKHEKTVLILNIQQLGTDALIRTFDLTAVSYLKKINLDYYDIQGFSKQPLHLISSSDKQGLDLLKVEYIKADKTGPNFQTTFENTEQTLKVAFSSMDLLLHSQALLSAISFLTEAIPNLPDKAKQNTEQKTEDKKTFVKKATKVSKDKDVFAFKLFAKLGAFCVNVWDGKNHIAEIKIQGLDSSILLQQSQIEVFARLQDIIVIDVNPQSIHKKAVSIMEDEVFKFNLTLYPEATQGEAYKDVSKVDGKMCLKVGCMQIVFLHKFLASLLNFLNNFQAAKEKLSVATTQAAKRAATSVKGLAERSFRLLMDIHLKAPVIIIPQSSVSNNAIVADLGLLRIHNVFSLILCDDQQLPPVVDCMTINLTKFKLSRTIMHSTPSHSDIQILYPINLNLMVNRNLAATWYHQIPGIEVKGHLDTLDVGMSQEDISVLLNVLVENLGEGETSYVKQTSDGGETAKYKDLLQAPKPPKKNVEEVTSEPVQASASASLSLLLHFEIKEVVVRLLRQVRGGGPPLHVLHVSQLGAEARMGLHEMAASVYLKKISMTCNEFKGPCSGESLLLINSSDDTSEQFLKMEYVKANQNGPEFKTFYKNTEQTLTVSMSSLDLILHTQALLSLMNFLSSALPSRETKIATQAPESIAQDDDPASTANQTALPSSAPEDAFILKLSAKLNAFNVFVCDEACNIADIRIQGMDASVDVQTKQTKIFARLQDIVVLDVDPKTIHRKAVFMMGEEVFSFNMILYSDATEGESYTDMSAVDGKLSLKVGCMHIVYLHKFLMSLLNFMNKFQAAKEALTTATAQAAEIAALSMKDFAQKSFRLSMDVHLKAPVIIIPQSSISTNAIVADLGLIKVQNKFSLVPGVDGPLPPIIDHMDIQLTKLQLSRTVLQSGSAQPELQLLQPVNLLVSLQRNLAVSWYSHIPGLQIDGKLEPMQIAVSQDDLKILMSCLFENLAETPSLPRAAQTPGIESSIESAERVKMEISESGELKGQPADDTQTGPAQDEESEPSTATLKFDFNFESLSVVLYNSKAAVWLHDENLRLGEMRLHMLTSTGKMFQDGSMEFSLCLRTCTLDDLREGITRATSRMIDQKDESRQGNMIDINYKQRGLNRLVTAILDKLYVCASIEFLMTVADLFINAMPQGPGVEKSAQIQPKQATLSHAKPGKGEIAEQPRFNVSALIMDPEIVFVASLAKADAPALAMSFQGKVTLSNVNNKQAIKAVVKELKVLACPFLRELRGHNITTILQPCSLQLESSTDDVGGQSASLSVGEVIIKISPIILNTVQTIAAALKPKPPVEEGTRSVIEHKNIWDVRNTDSCDNWFLGVDVAHEAEDCFQMEEDAKKLQNFDLEVKSVQVTMECGLGHRTVPLLLVESTLTGTVKNWSSFVNVNADTTLEIHYYNENYAVWEPLIERVDDGNRCWSLKLEMKNNPVQDRSFLPGDDFILLPEPQSAISISSRDTMNITISKCSLSVFSNLAKAFSEGTASTFDYSLKDRAPVTVKNALGVPIILQHGGNMREFGSSKQESIHEVPKGQSFDLEFSSTESLHRGKLSALRRQESSLFTIGIVPHGYTEMGNIPITKPSRRLYNIRSPTQETCVSVLVQIDATEGNKVISVRSPLQIKNHFSVPFVVCKYVPNAKLLEAIGVCRPDEEFHVPLNSYRCQLFLKPSGSLEGQFTTSTTYIMWKEMLHRSSEVRCTLQCPAAEVNFLPLIVNCQAVPDEINFIASNGEKDWDPAYIIHLYPSLTLRNLLPYSFRYLLEGAAEAPELAEGSSCDIIHSRIDGEIMELVLVKYQGRNWNGHFRIRDTVPEFFAVCFTADTSELMTVDLHIHVKRIGNRMIMSVFSPYWIINKTSRILQYRAEDIHVKHPADYRDVILFSFKKKNIFSKNKIQLCISTSSWSTGFSLDTVGSYGCVKCPAGKIQYLVGVNIKMSSFNLSRIVTLTPFYTLVNKTDMELEVGEVTADGSLPDFKWYYVSSSECVPFWPENISGKMCVRVIGCEGISKPFFFNKQDNGTLLSLASMNTGLIVDISIADHSIVIKFSDYYEGAAPAFIMNHTPRAKLTYMQSGTEKEHEIGPGQARLFAWEDPTGIKKLTWKYSENTGELDLLKDESGQFAHNQDVQIHWVSFLDGRQRVLLFTEDVALVTKARQAEEMEQPDQEITVSIHSLGLSLINNEEKQEISYIGITSSGIIWEMKPKLKWKPFNQKQIMQLEQAYQKYRTAEDSRWTKIDSNFEVSFSKVPMEMRLPHKCSIRRNFVSGIHIEFKQSSHQRSLRAQLYWLQVDNQLPGSMFPVVFHPVAPPKSIALDSEPKPFIDVSIITRFNEFSKVMQFKYFMVLIQCMALKVDQGFLASIIDLFTPDTDTEAERQRTQLIQRDLDSLNRELMESSMTDITTLSFFEHFHISPLKLHLSLSLGAGGGSSDKEELEIVAISSVNLLLKSIGATLTDVDDLIFKLACFEVKYQFYKRSQLMSLVTRHYSEQFLKQLYVLVLGLDVLGNPFGLIRGLSEGVEAFFYEPFQGAVQGPEEFAEGFVIGVKSLLGHTVGGAAGVVSRITGSVGKGLAAITMDKEYQQKRREEMGRQPKDFGDSLAKGGKGLLRGVVGGVTGIITKPVEGAKKEGAAGFFKGIGKGLVGVVARPTGGIIDMASSTFQGIQRVAESTEDVSPLRPPRFIHEDGIIRPYNQNEAQGFNLFENSNIQKVDGEIYRYSCFLNQNKKVNLVVTNKRIMCVKEVEILGHRSIDWDYAFEEFVYPPTVDENVLNLTVKDHSIFQKKSHTSQEILKRIPLQNQTMAKKVLSVIDEARVSWRQQTLVRKPSERFIKQYQRSFSDSFQSVDRK